MGKIEADSKSEVGRAEYACHVGDNLRQWSERLQGALHAQQRRIAGYDPDALAAARGYAALPLAVAAWSSELAAIAWVEVLERALHENIELEHASRADVPGRLFVTINAQVTAVHGGGGTLLTADRESLDPRHGGRFPRAYPPQASFKTLVR